MEPIGPHQSKLLITKKKNREHTHAGECKVKEDIRNKQVKTLYWP